MARYTPTPDDFAALAGEGNLVPVYRELLVDGETPVSAFAKLRGEGQRPFLLESLVGGEKWAAYSFIGVGARACLRVGAGRYQIDRFDVEDEGASRREEGALPGSDPTAPLEALLGSYRPAPTPGLPRFFGGAVGWLSYDVARAFERLGQGPPDELGLPEACFVITDTLVIFDNLRQTVKVVAGALVPSERPTKAAIAASYAAAVRRIDAVVEALQRPAAPLSSIDPVVPAEETRLASNTTREQFHAAVRRAKEYILAGDVFQVVLSQRFATARPAGDPFDVYRALRVVNPSPYMFHLAFPEAQITGASPEVLVRVVDGRVTVRPIAGTRRRGATPEHDLRLEAELLASEKERAEHVMLIDLGRNDVGRVARVGTVQLDERMVVERFSHVMHLTSSVSGELAPQKSAFDALRACFPAGTLTGAPKIRAMQIIDELEPCRRGIYGGAVGYFSFTGNCDLAIAIRTLVTRGDRVYLQAGAGIVADSEPDAEYEETVSKARALVKALRMAACSSS